MTTTYESGKIFKDAEEDIYADGCQPGSGGGCGSLDLEFTAGSPLELIEKVREYLSAEKVDVLVAACDEEGRVDIQIMETADGSAAGKNDIERWKRAELRLWLACYSFHVRRVTREDVDLSAAAEVMAAGYSK